MNPYTLVRVARIALLIALLSCFAWLILGHPASRRFRHVVRAILIAAALGFVNFGVFHVAWGPIHYWDAFHYFMGAKYLPELEYSALYDATLVAGRELGAFAAIRDVRDLTTYEIRPAAAVNADGVRARFTPDRWRSFKRDLVFFGPHIRNWDRLFIDHGYNDPPPRAMLLHLIVRRVPATTAALAILTSLDYLLLLGAFAAVRWAYGDLPAQLAAAFFCLSFFGTFDFIGGSILRWDWISALLAGTALLSRGWPATAGALFAYAVLARIFPLLFLVPVGVKWLQGRARASTDRATGRCLAVAAGVVIAAAAAVTLSPRGPELFASFGSKIQVHSADIASNSVGLGPLIGMATAPLTAAPDGSIYISEPASAASRPPRSVLVLATIVCTAAVIPLILRARAVASMMYAVPLVFCVLSLASYYYSFLVLLVLLPWHGDTTDRARLIGMALLTGLMAWAYVLQLRSGEYFPLYYEVAIGLFLFFLAWLILEYVRAAGDRFNRRPDVDSASRATASGTAR